MSWRSWDGESWQGGHVGGVVARLVLPQLLLALTAARAEQTKRTRFRKDVPDHAAFRFVPFAVETCGYIGKEAVRFVNRLGGS